LDSGGYLGCRWFLPIIFHLKYHVIAFDIKVEVWHARAMKMLNTALFVSLMPLLFSAQAFAYDIQATQALNHAIRSGKQMKAKYKPSHAKDHYDTEILDYYYNFGDMLQGGLYYPFKNYDLRYHMRRVGSFQRKDELGPFPRGEALFVRWKYKKKYFEEHVDLKPLLADVHFDDSGRLYEDKTWFKLFVKVKGQALFIYMNERGKDEKLIYQSGVQ